MAGKDKRQKIAPLKEGRCALLNIEGKFAKSHLIPRALTGADSPGERFIEAGRGSRPIRRYSSWYDHHMVIAEGEKILSLIDDAGIAELRKHRLVWSGFAGKKKLHINDFLVPPDPVTGIGVREILDVDQNKIRLFFLSLLWRALKTSIKEFEYLENLNVDLELLASHLVRLESGLPSYLPIVISQISTVGFTHNHSPTIQESVFPDGKTYRFYRFYMQGVIAHVYIGCESLHVDAPAMVVGGADSLVVVTHKFENSRQFAEARDSIVEAHQQWPGFKS
ncbi:hypothetical protein ACJ6YJ_14865 [Pseudomonas marginalis]|uniref:hypothetical protein n=1 Tax=Pseudomonas TaxID=286 RepID=UPI0038999685